MHYTHSLSSIFPSHSYSFVGENETPFITRVTNWNYEQVQYHIPLPAAIKMSTSAIQTIASTYRLPPTITISPTARLRVLPRPQSFRSSQAILSFSPHLSFVSTFGEALARRLSLSARAHHPPVTIITRLSAVRLYSRIMYTTSRGRGDERFSLCARSSCSFLRTKRTFKSVNSGEPAE